MRGRERKMNVNKLMASPTFVASIMSALLSAIALVWTGINNHKVNSLAKKKIDADIKSQSRIKWIQDVRQATVELEDAFRKLYLCAYENHENRIGTYNVKLEEALTNYQNKINTLILFFGYRKNKNEQSNGSTFSISSELRSQESPNDIGLFDQEELREARSKVKHEEQEISHEKGNNNKIIDKLLDRNRQDNSHLNEIIATYLNGLYKTAGNISFGNKDVDKKYQRTANELHNTEVIKGYVEKLVPIISIYLKIEWDRAKNIE